MATTSNRIEVFYAYAHKDEQLRDELEKHLSVLQRQDVISSWHDRRIDAGTEWAEEIDEHLNAAQIIVLLVSPDFLASDYCYAKEMKRAMERHNAREARVIPIILRHCLWKGAPFSKLQALPKDGYPITSWSDPDEAFLDVATGIKEAIQRLVPSTTGRPVEQWQTPCHTFIGRALVNGNPPPVGTPIVALIGGEKLGSVSVRQDGTYGPLRVPQGDGNKVLFLIGEAAAKQTAVWEERGQDVLNLTTGNIAPMQRHYGKKVVRRS